MKLPLKLKFYVYFADTPSLLKIMIIITGDMSTDFFFEVVEFFFRMSLFSPALSNTMSHAFIFMKKRHNLAQTYLIQIFLAKINFSRDCSICH